jgi:branched-chain amino acid transport system permease protein
MTGGRRGNLWANPWAMALAAIAVLAAAQFVLPSYHHTNMARIMVFAVFAIGYNVAFGFAGLLSLGHAMFFGAGLYAAGMSAQFLGFSMPAAFVAGIAGGLVLALATGLIVLRTSGVAFMIVTLMFSQAAYLTILYFNSFTRGDEGFVVAEGMRQIALGGAVLPLSDPDLRYNLALLLFALAYLSSIAILRAPIGRVLVAVRENESRAQMLGYNTFGYKLLALTMSGALAGAAGAAYALLFAYVGATFASIQYSIYPLLWVLLGGAGTTLGPLIGTAAMFYLVEFSSEVTSSYLIVVGVLLVVLVLAFPKGVIGTIGAKWGAPRS